MAYSPVERPRQTSFTSPGYDHGSRRPSMLLRSDSMSPPQAKRQRLNTYPSVGPPSSSSNESPEYRESPRSPNMTRSFNYERIPTGPRSNQSSRGVECDDISHSDLCCPHLLIHACYLRPNRNMVRHLSNFLWKTQLRPNIKFNPIGYYLLFPDSRRGVDDLMEMYRLCNDQLLFSEYRLRMEIYPEQLRLNTSTYDISTRTNLVPDGFRLRSNAESTGMIRGPPQIWLSSPSIPSNLAVSSQPAILEVRANREPDPNPAKLAELFKRTNTTDHDLHGAITQPRPKTTGCDVSSSSRPLRSDELFSRADALGAPPPERLATPDLPVLSQAQAIRSTSQISVLSQALTWSRLRNDDDVASNRSATPSEVSSVAIRELMKICYGCKQAESALNLLMRCSSCWRRFHETCRIPQVKPSDTTDEWHCRHCVKRKRHLKAAGVQPASPDRLTLANRPFWNQFSNSEQGAGITDLSTKQSDATSCTDRFPDHKDSAQPSSPLFVICRPKDDGVSKEDRTGVGTAEVIDGDPEIDTTRKLSVVLKKILAEHTEPSRLATKEPPHTLTEDSDVPMSMSASPSAQSLEEYLSPPTEVSGNDHATLDDDVTKRSRHIEHRQSHGSNEVHEPCNSAAELEDASSLAPALQDADTRLVDEAFRSPEPQSKMCPTANKPSMQTCSICKKKIYGTRRESTCRKCRDNQILTNPSSNEPSANQKVVSGHANLEVEHESAAWHASSAQSHSLNSSSGVRSATTRSLVARKALVVAKRAPSIRRIPVSYLPTSKPESAQGVPLKQSIPPIVAKKIESVDPKDAAASVIPSREHSPLSTWVSAAPFPLTGNSCEQTEVLDECSTSGGNGNSDTLPGASYNQQAIPSTSDNASTPDDDLDRADPEAITRGCRRPSNDALPVNKTDIVTAELPNDASRTGPAGSRQPSSHGGYKGHDTDSDSDAPLLKKMRCARKTVYKTKDDGGASALFSRSSCSDEEQATDSGSDNVSMREHMHNLTEARRLSMAAFETWRSNTSQPEVDATSKRVDSFKVDTHLTPADPALPASNERTVRPVTNEHHDLYRDLRIRDSPLIQHSTQHSSRPDHDTGQPKQQLYDALRQPAENDLIPQPNYTLLELAALAIANAPDERVNSKQAIDWILSQRFPHYPASRREWQGGVKSKLSAWFKRDSKRPSDNNLAYYTFGPSQKEHFGDLFTNGRSSVYGFRMGDEPKAVWRPVGPNDNTASDLRHSLIQRTARESVGASQVSSNRLKRLEEHTVHPSPPSTSRSFRPAPCSNNDNAVSLVDFVEDVLIEQDAPTASIPHAATVHLQHDCNKYSCSFILSEVENEYEISETENSAWDQGLVHILNTDPQFNRFDTKDLFAARPDLHPDNAFNAQDKRAEINQRPSRGDIKRMKRNGEHIVPRPMLVDRYKSHKEPHPSSSTKQVAEELGSSDVLPEAEVQDALMTFDTFADEEPNWSRAKTVDEVFGMPNNTVLMVDREGDLAFRDGVRIDGVLPRARTTWKVGRLKQVRSQRI